MITVAIAGCSGKMGKTISSAVLSADDIELVCGIDPITTGDETFPVCESLEAAIATYKFSVLVDFTQPNSVYGNVKLALENGIDCVVGTTGITNEQLSELAACATNDASLFYAPNFTTGAVLMMQFSKLASKYFPEAEIIEYHHCNKKDAPSGTAKLTAELISLGRDGGSSTAPGKETETAGCEGVRGGLVCGVPVHSVRSDGFVASQEVIFGSYGQSLTIKHDSWDRSSYIPGVLLGIRSVQSLSGLVVGLESIMGLV